MQAEGQRFDLHSSRKNFPDYFCITGRNVPPFIKNGTAPAGSNWKLSPVGLTHHRSTISRPKRVPKRGWAPRHNTILCYADSLLFFFFEIRGRFCCAISDPSGSRGRSDLTEVIVQENKRKRFTKVFTKPYLNQKQNISNL
jgi:hypothetical protein